MRKPLLKLARPERSLAGFAEYQLKLPDKKVLQAKLHEFFQIEASQD